MYKQEYQEILRRGEKYLRENDFDGFFYDYDIFLIRDYYLRPDFIDILLNNNYTDFLNLMTHVPEALFHKCSYDKPLVIPSNIKEIERNAFYESNIPNIILSEGLKKIEETAFSRSTIKKIKIPESCTEIRHNCFGECDYLTDIYLPKSFTFVFNRFIDYREDQKIHSPNNIEDFNFLVKKDKEKFEECLVK